MKKISVIALILAVLMILCACGKDTENKESETTAAETDKAEALAIDFATVKVSGFVYGYVGEGDAYLAAGAEEYVSSRPSVATVDESGKINANTPGVTLVGYEKDGKQQAVAVCIFAKGQKPDRSSGGSAEVVEVGGSYMHTAPIGGAEYTSSNENVVDTAEAPTLKFVGRGYACITCASASRPFTYSFIVYDRTVE